MNYVNNDFDDDSGKNLDNHLISLFTIDDIDDGEIEMSSNDSTLILSNKKKINNRHRKKKNIELVHNYRKNIMHLR